MPQDEDCLLNPVFSLAANKTNYGVDSGAFKLEKAFSRDDLHGDKAACRPRQKANKNGLYLPFECLALSSA